MRIRIKFTKSGPMRFVGHLDMMRYFQKAIVRAGIDITYTSGFSPHQIMSFALPLGVGLSSSGEYLDIEVNSSDTTMNALASLNSVMAEGVTVTRYLRLKEGAKKAMSAVSAAEYAVCYKKRYKEDLSFDEMTRAVMDLCKREEIIVTKKTKKSEKTFNLRPLIYHFEVLLYEGRPGFHMRHSAGSTDNIKPELVLETMFKEAGISYDPLKMQIHRVDLFEDASCGLLPLSAAGEIIY